MLISGLGRLQAVAMYAGVKEAKYYPSMFGMIIVLVSAWVKIHSITSAQGKTLVHVDTFVIVDFIMFVYKGISSKPASKTFWSLIMWYNYPHLNSGSAHVTTFVSSYIISILGKTSKSASSWWTLAFFFPPFFGMLWCEEWSCNITISINNFVSLWSNKMHSHQ